MDRRRYGRFSKSIDVNVHGCGVASCGGARLVALFKTRERKSKDPETPSKSRMATEKPRGKATLENIDNCNWLIPPSDSPLRLNTSPTKLPRAQDNSLDIITVHDSSTILELYDDDEDSDIEILATNLAAVAMK